ncbi:MspA family protein [Mycobacteroides abscessus]|uniref:MspA family porin n=1 Tax=Mycobacteroides abscessus TaxID=36809 RepID=UPI000C257EC5|nr:MspA family protein [Mycobacteroides abscessus]RIS83596.1 MspA family protein [Mycobacteroides abscessus]
MRSKRLHTAAAGLAALSAISVAITSAPISTAEPQPMAPQHEMKVTRGGWSLNLTLAEETINPVPNLAAAANSREAFVTFEATATASGGKAAMTDSTFVAGYQLGCQIDVSSGLQIGGAAAIAPSASVGLSPGGPGVNAGIGGGVTGYLQTNLQPGVITDLPMASMPLGSAGYGMVDVTNMHIKADACGGPVTIRSFAYIRISTDVERSEFAIYGDPIQI